MNKKEQVWVVLESIGVVFLLSWFFYRSFWAIVPLLAAGFFYGKQKTKQIVKKHREELEGQFKECILAVATAMQAGYAVENAFGESAKDMKQLYGEDSAIYKELEVIRRGLVINISLEELLFSFSERSRSEAILQFAQVFSIAKKSGGSMPEIIRSSADLIGKQIDARAEMQTVLSGRRMEQNIMKLMPFAILMYVGTTTPGYFDVLYGNLTGIAIMSVCLAVYIVSFFLGENILNKLEEEM